MSIGLKPFLRPSNSRHSLICLLRPCKTNHFHALLLSGNERQKGCKNVYAKVRWREKSREVSRISCFLFYLGRRFLHDLSADFLRKIIYWKYWAAFSLVRATTRPSFHKSCWRQSKIRKCLWKSMKHQQQQEQRIINKRTWLKYLLATMATITISSLKRTKY